MLLNVHIDIDGCTENFVPALKIKIDLQSCFIPEYMTENLLTIAVHRQNMTTVFHFIYDIKIECDLDRQAHE